MGGSLEVKDLTYFQEKIAKYVTELQLARDAIAEWSSICMVLLHELGDEFIIDQTDERVKALVDGILSGKFGVTLEKMDGDNIVKLTLTPIEDKHA